MNLLEAVDCSYAYTRQSVLRGVSMGVAPGEVVALLGPNGCGKSTLLKLLLGHLSPTTGTVTLQQRPLAAYARRELARRIAYLPQTPSHLPGETVADVLRLGRLPYWGAFGLESPRDGEVVSSVASELQLSDLLSRPMDTLSGGQRQRAFIGRCLVQEPQVLLLDEPATFLDLRHQLDLHRLLLQLSRQKALAVLMAGHDLNLAATHADRLILLDSGEIAADGAPADVLREDVLHRVYGVRLRRVDVNGVVTLAPGE